VLLTKCQIIAFVTNGHDLLPSLTIALSAPNSGCQCNNLLVIVGKQSYNSLCPGLLMHFWNLWEDSSNNIQFQP
jgi:hypothetical protein